MDSPSLNIVFAGTPEFAAHHLQALVDSHHRVLAVYTQPDRPAGRGKKLTPSPVKQLAQAAGLPVYQPVSLRDAEAQAQLRELNADIMVVVAYGLLLPQAVLDAPHLGCINVHASLLPRWRGAAPIQRAIEAGDTESGVTIMQMEAGLDTGPMLHKARCSIKAEDTAAILHDRLAMLGPPALLDTLAALAAGTARPEPQDDSQSNYARKLDKAEAEIDWRRSAIELDRLVRAFIPFPVAYTETNGERVRIHAAQPAIIAPRPFRHSRAGGNPAGAQDMDSRLRGNDDFETVSPQPGTVIGVDNQGIVVSCGSGTLRITRLQLPGKKPMNAAEFINGFSGYLTPGQILGGSA